MFLSFDADVDVKPFMTAKDLANSGLETHGKIWNFRLYVDDLHAA